MQKHKYNIRGMQFEQFDLFLTLAFDLTSKHHNSIITDVLTQLNNDFLVLPRRVRLNCHGIHFLVLQNFVNELPAFTGQVLGCIER